MNGNGEGGVEISEVVGTLVIGPTGCFAINSNWGGGGRDAVSFYWDFKVAV